MTNDFNCTINIGHDLSEVGAVEGTDPSNFGKPYFLTRNCKAKDKRTGHKHCTLVFKSVFHWSMF